MSRSRWRAWTLAASTVSVWTLTCSWPRRRERRASRRHGSMRGRGWPIAGSTRDAEMQVLATARTTPSGITSAWKRVLPTIKLARGARQHLQSLNTQF